MKWPISVCDFQRALFSQLSPPSRGLSSSQVDIQLSLVEPRWNAGSATACLLPPTCFAFGTFSRAGLPFAMEFCLMNEHAYHILVCIRHIRSLFIQIKRSYSLLFPFFPTRSSLFKLYWIFFCFIFFLP